METDKNKICFIICVNDDLFFRECMKYIEWLEVPEGMWVEIVEIRDAASMTSGYNEGMYSSDARYKVYMHQDVFIINRFFIYDMLNLFELDAAIGMIGLVGNLKMPSNGVMWSGERVLFGPKALESSWENYRYQLEDGFWDVDCVDGLLMATQYDIPWRENLFDGWDFYDISQSFEMKRKGYHIIVPVQNEKWFIHDDKQVLSLWNYDKYRRIFLKEYMEDMQNGRKR